MLFILKIVFNLQNDKIYDIYYEKVDEFARKLESFRNSRIYELKRQKTAKDIKEQEKEEYKVPLELRNKFFRSFLTRV
jgi:hypothetical protein